MNDSLELKHDIGFLYNGDVEWMLEKGIPKGSRKKELFYTYDFLYIAVRDPDFEWLYMYQKMNLAERLGSRLTDRADKHIVFRYEDGLLTVSVDGSSLTFDPNTLYELGYIEHDDQEYPDFGSTYVLNDYSIDIGDGPVPETEEDESVNSVPDGQKEKTDYIAPGIERYFEDLTGMHAVKVELSKAYETLRFVQEQQTRGNDKAGAGFPFNFWIAGERGSGKKTVARIIARMLYDFKMTDAPEPRFVRPGEVTEKPEVLQTGEGKRETVVIENTEKLLENGKRDDAQDTSSNVMENEPWLYIKECLKAADKNKNTFYVFTGHERAMLDAFEKRNTDVRNMVSVINILKYSVDEMCDILNDLCNKEDLYLDSDALAEVRKTINLGLAIDDFENIHTIVGYIVEAKRRKIMRLRNSREKDRFLTASDFHMEDDDPETLEDLLNELENMTGLEAVKRSVREKVRLVERQNEERKKGKKVNPVGMNALYLGSPGTGKTVVARLVGRIYKKLGLLPKGQFIEADAESFRAGYTGQTAIKTKNKVAEAMGGVLFIDEAYNICNSGNDDFGKEAVATLLKLIEDNRDRMMVIMAGYEKEMTEFLRVNSGFKSRFQETVVFEDYTEDELLAIFLSIVKQYYSYIIPDELLPKIRQIIAERKRTDRENFANGREMRTMAEELERAVSMLNVDNDEEVVITEQHLKYISGIDSSAGDESYEELLKELDSLIGLESVKRAVRQTLNKEQRRKKKFLQAEKEYRAENLHMLFYGNAGSGKTMVAKLVGRIFAKAGILPRSDIFVTASRENLVAGYLGQTAERTKNLVKKAMGGVLFVDEAYNLVNGDNDTFGMEALNELIAPLYNEKGNFMVIMAGYENEMKELAKKNQGFDSRFGTTLYFEDYTLEELREIFYMMLPKKMLTIEPGLEEVVEEAIKKRKERIVSRGKDFGNARGVEVFIEKIEGCLSERLFELDEAGKKTPEGEECITKADIEAAVCL